MNRYSRPMMFAGLLFTIIMMVLGWITIARVGWDMFAIILGVLGLGAVALTAWSVHQDKLMSAATGTLAAGLFFPTAWGAIPMIIGFVLFILMISLQLFITTFND